MSLKLRDFKCTSCGASKEALVKDDKLELKCDCGGVMVRQLSAPMGRGNFAHGYLKPKFNK